MVAPAGFHRAPSRDASATHERRTRARASTDRWTRRPNRRTYWSRRVAVAAGRAARRRRGAGAADQSGASARGALRFVRSAAGLQRRRRTLQRRHAARRRAAVVGRGRQPLRRPPRHGRRCAQRRALRRGHVAGAVHLPCASSRIAANAALDRLVGKETLVVYGDSTEEAMPVAEELRRRGERPGLRVAVLAGGFPAWSQAGLACSSGPCADCGVHR